MGRKSFSTEMSLPTQSPALRAVFRSMGNWTLLSYVVSEGFFFFCTFSSLQPKVFWRGQWMELGCLGGFIWLSYGKNKINLLHQEEGLVLYKHNHCCLLLLLGELVDIFQSKYFPLSLQLMSSSFLPSSSSSPSVWQVLFF